MFFADAQVVPQGRWTQGHSIDSKGEFSAMISEALDEVPTLAPARPDGIAQPGQMSAGSQTSSPSGPAGVI